MINYYDIVNTTDTLHGDIIKICSKYPDRTIPTYIPSNVDVASSAGIVHACS